MRSNPRPAPLPCMSDGEEDCLPEMHGQLGAESVLEPPRTPGLVNSPLLRVVSFSTSMDWWPWARWDQGRQEVSKWGVSVGQWQSNAPSRMWLFKGVRRDDGVSRLFPSVVLLQSTIFIKQFTVQI